MNMKKISSLLLCSLLSFNMVACSTDLESTTSETSVSADNITEAEQETPAETEVSSEPTKESEAEALEETSSENETDTQTPLSDQFTLYITLDQGASYEEVPFTSSESLTAELLIGELAAQTGWNLDLSDMVTSGKGGMTVSFANTSSLFVGPPDPQVEEYFVFDADGLTSAILDSITYTLQQNFVDTSLGGDPSSLDIYYCGEGDTELYFENTGGYVPFTEPYTGILYDTNESS